MPQRESTWTPIPFSMAWTGHLITGCLTSFSVLVLVGLSRGLFSWQSDFSKSFVTVAICWILTETLSTFSDRWQERVQQRDSPGGWLPAVARIVSFVLVYLLVSLITLRYSQDVILCVTAATIVVFCELLLLRPWQPGLTRTQVRVAWEETKLMTKRVAREDESESE